MKNKLSRWDYALNYWDADYESPVKNHLYIRDSPKR